MADLSRNYLIDKSAFARIATSQAVAAVVKPVITAGRVAYCGVLALEAGFSARNLADHKRLSSVLGALPVERVLPADWERAFDVQGSLARRGKHRAAGLADLLQAAVAERTGRIVLHYDSDFDVISAVTKQPVEWVVPRGSL